MMRKVFGDGSDEEDEIHGEGNLRLIFVVVVVFFFFFLKFKLTFI